MAGTGTSHDRAAGRQGGHRHIGAAETATRETVLVVRLRDGREVTTIAATTADPDGGNRVVAGLRRLLWLRIDLTDRRRPCTLIGIGCRGPRTRTLPLSAALALAAAGIHTIVTVHAANRAER
jgi:hypothetical protein